MNGLQKYTSPFHDDEWGQSVYKSNGNTRMRRHKGGVVLAGITPIVNHTDVEEYSGLWDFIMKWQCGGYQNLHINDA